jgi:hypothetical protein
MMVGMDINIPEPMAAVVAVAPGVVATETAHVIVAAPDGVVYVYTAMAKRIVNDGTRVVLGTVLGFKLAADKSPSVIEVRVPAKAPEKPQAKASGAAATPQAPATPPTPKTQPQKPVAPPAAVAPLAAAGAIVAALWLRQASAPKKPAWKRMKPRYPDYRKGRKR